MYLLAAETCDVKVDKPCWTDIALNLCDMAVLAYCFRNKFHAYCRCCSLLRKLNYVISSPVTSQLCHYVATYKHVRFTVSKLPTAWYENVLVFHMELAGLYKLH